MSTQYESITLFRPAPWKPGWQPGPSGTRDTYKYGQPDYEVWRADGDCVYKLVHIETGEAAEVPVSIVRHAVLIGEKAAAERKRLAEVRAKGGK